MEVSLFPFLSILVCLIGSLVILIVALSIAETRGSQDDAAGERAVELDALVRRLAELQAEAAGLRAREGGALAFDELIRLQQQAADLEQKAAAPGPPKPADQSRELAAAITRAKEQEKSLLKQLQEAELKLGTLARAVPAGVPLRVLPGGGFARNLSPLFIETRKDDVVIHAPSRTVEVPRGKLAADPDFQRAARFAADSEDRLVVFLVRADSRSTFYAAQDAARKLGAVTGKVPLIGDGELDLSGFLGPRP
jgi:hypothetical protein